MPNPAGAADSGRERDWARLDALLEALLELEPEAARRELDRLPPADVALRERLAVALAAADDERGPLARSAVESWAPLLEEDADAGASTELAPGFRLGAWEIEGELGRGGMGTVYAVRRADGTFAQRAALKLLAASADAPEARARFVQERQILARLEHSAIARLLDGGVAPDGRPWLVLERVDGAAITLWADAQRLSLVERLRLFAQVLEAVEYAHRNLVVHRDLKPTNIWVSESGAVKLLDFGIAKLLAEDDDVLATRARLGVALTPQYAAPEQLTGGAITTATDVYALGLVLYELLAGTRPYRVASSSALALERAVVATEAPSLAAAFRGAGASAEIAAARATTPDRLLRQLAGDLDAIVHKALAKDPAARYASAEALSRDLANHLAGRAIEAHAESLVTRARKFVRRHRTGVAAATALGVALLAGVIAAGFALAQSRARLAEAHRAEAIQAFLLEMVSAVDPERALGRDVSLREIVDRGAERLAVELRDQPAARAELLRTLGTIYHRLGDHAAAERLLDEALVAARAHYGATSLETARALGALGELHYWRDDHERALALQREALAVFAAAGGPGRAEAASARFNVGATLRQLERLDEAYAAEREALALERELHGETSLGYAEVACGLALVLHDLERDEEALPLARSAVASYRQLLVAEHPRTANALEALGLVLKGAGEPEAAIAPLEESLAIRRRVYGSRHPATLQALNNLGSTLEDAGRLEAALTVREEASALARATLPATSDTLAMVINNAATLAYRLRRFEVAARGFAEAVAIWRQTAGERSGRVGTARNNLGAALLELDRAREALAELVAALAIRREIAGAESAEAAQTLRLLGLARLATDDRAGARSDLDRSVELSRRLYAERHPRLADALASRARLALAERRLADARRDLEEALSIREQRLGAEAPVTVETRAALAALAPGTG